jgi:hypothetical protein
MSEIPFVTSETDLASYLLLSGFKLIVIQYEPRQNGKQRGLFFFEADERLDEFKNLFESGQASVNVADFKETKMGLLDRVLKGLP